MLTDDTLANAKRLVDIYIHDVVVYPYRIVVIFNLFSHLRPYRPNDTDDQEGHSKTECLSFVDDGVPDSMTVDAQRTPFSTGEERTYAKGMEILNRLRR